MAKKPALGKGIDALMGPSPTVPSSNELSGTAQHGEVTPSPSVHYTDNQPNPAAVNEIPVDLIDVNPYQPRHEFDDDELAALADSIRQLGIIQPITLRKLDTRYQIISGERRWRAAKLAGLKQVPAYVRTADDQGMIEMALVENIQRADLNAIEIALSFQRLISECNLSQEELAPRVGKKRATISNYLRLLKLPDEVQFSVRQNLLSMGHARALLPLEDAQQQILLMREIIDESLSVRAVEEMVKNIMAERQSAAEQEQERSADEMTKEDTGYDYLPSMQSQLESLLGWGVEVKPAPNGRGKVVISYRSEGERQELMRKLGLSHS